MTITSQIFYLTSSGFGSTGSGQTIERLSVFGSDLGTQTTISSSLVLDYTTSIGVDTAAGYYFALVATDSYGQTVQLVRGSLGGGAAVTLATFNNATGADQTDDPNIFSLAVDPIQHRIYVGMQEATGSSTTASGIFRYDYNAATGALVSLTPTAVATIASSGKPAESGFAVFDPTGMALDVATGNLFFVEQLSGGVDVEGVWRVDTTTGATTQIVSQAQFPDTHTNGYIDDVAVNPVTGLVYFSVHSGPAPGDPGYNAALNKIFYVPENAAAGSTATQLTLTGIPGGTNFYPQKLTIDPAGFLYVSSEELNSGTGVAGNDVIYKFAFNGAGTSASYVGTVSPNPNFPIDDNSFGDLIINPIPTLVVTGTASPVTEQGAAVTLLTGSPTITDIGGGYLNGATVVVGGAGNFQFFDDTLAANTSGTSITASFNSANETLTLSGYDTLAHYAQVLGTVTLASTGDNPTNGGAATTRTITWTVTDGTLTVPAGSQNTSVSTVNISAVNDPPVNTVGATATVTEDATNVTINGWSIADPDAGSNTMTVVLSVTHGTLNVATPALGGTVTNNNTASVTVTGAVTAINSVITTGGVKYTPDANFNGTSDKLHIVTSDGGATGGGTLTDTDDKAITVTAVNDAPVVSGDGTESVADVIGGSPDPTGVLISTLFAGQFSDATDSVAFTGGSISNGFEGIAVISGITSAAGTWQYSTGAAPTTWIDIVDSNLADSDFFQIRGSGHLRFNGTAGANGPAPTLVVRLSDSSTAMGTDGLITIPSTGGTTQWSSGTVSVSTNVLSGNQPPTSTNLSGDLAVYTEQGSVVALDVSGNATIADTDSADFDTGSLTVFLAAGTSHDSLSIASVGTITTSGNTVSFGGTQFATFTGGGFGGGGLTFSFDADATPAAVQALVRAIRYDNDAGDTPTSGTRNVTWTLNDGDGTANGGNPILTVTSQLQIVAVNDAPGLDTSKSPTMTTILEDAGAPVGAVGTLVSALIDDTAVGGGIDNFTDPDGTLVGIAIRAANTGTGSWWFSTNNGTTWTALGSPTEATSRLLAADANTRLYYQPASNTNGTLTTALEIRAWDGTSGTNGGTGNATINGGSTAFSSTVDNVSITVTPVNDAPVNTVPGAQLGQADGSLIFSSGNSNAILVSDIDAGSGNVTVTLTASNGNATLGTTAGLASVSGNGTGTVTLSGTVTAINTALDNTAYAFTAGYSGAATLQVSTSDNGNTGGGALSDTDTINITVIDPPHATITQTIAGAAGDPAGPNKPADFDITFSQPIDPASFTLADLSLGSSTASGAAFSGGLVTISSGTHYHISTTATGNGNIVLTLANGSVYAAGHNNEPVYGNTATVYTDNTITWDQVAPTVTINQGSGQNDPTGGSIVFDIVFSEPVTGFDSADISLTGTSNPTTKSITGSGTNYTLTVSGMTLGGTVIASVLANGAVDSALNGNAASTSTDNTVTFQPNAAPVLDNTKSPVLTAELEDAGAPSGAVGTLVSTLVDNVSPVGGLDNVTDADGPALGIAVTGAVTTNGSWFFSTDNGGTWTALGSVSDASARLLSANATTRVYFQPNANYNGTQATALTFRAWDGFTGTNGGTADTSTNGGSTAFSTATDTASLTITSVNDPSVINAYSINAKEDVPATAGGTGSLSISSGNGFEFLTYKSVIVTSLPASGTLTVGGNPVVVGQEYPIASFNDFGSVLVFTSDPNTFGTPYTTFGLQVRDNDGTANGGNDLSAVFTATVNVSPVADAPVVTGATTNEDTQTASGLVVSRNAVDGSEVTHFKITGITGGTLFKNDGTTQITNGTFITFAEANAGLKFTPTANSFGSGGFDVAGATDSFGNGLGVSSHATITVNPVADTPAITATTTNEDTQSTTGLVISRNAVDGSEVTHFKITGIANGTLFLNDGVTQVTNGSFITFAQANAGLKFSPAANYNGIGATFNVQASLNASDAGLGGSVVAASITVNAVNDAPVNTVPASVTTNEDTALSFTLGNTLSITDVDGTTVQVTLGVSHGTLTMTTLSGLIFSTGDGTADASMTFGGSLINVNNALASLTYAPTLNYNGADTLSVLTSDLGNTGSGGVLTDTDSIAITVNSVNDAPAGTTATLNGTEDTTFVFTAANFGFSDASDSPANALAAVIIATLPTAGALKLDGVAVTAGQSVAVADINAGKLTYVPVADANGSTGTSFTFQVKDDGGTANGGVDTDQSANTMTINLAAVNDAPVNTVPATASTNEDTTLAFTGTRLVSVADVDAAEGTGNVQVTLGVAHGTLTMGTLAGLVFTTGDGTADATMTFSGSVASVNTALASLTYLPALNYNGADTLTVTTSDLGNTGSGGTLVDTDTVAITVNPVNDAPTAPGSRSLTIAEDSSTGAVAIGASDIDGDTLAYALKAGAGPLKGAVSFNQALGTFTYTPIANANGADNFTVVISDGHGGTAEQFVSVGITPVNDPPVAQPDTLTTIEGVAISVPTSQLTGNDSDVDGDLLVITSVFGANGGTVSQVGSTITFVPFTGFSGAAGFNYTLSDTNGGTSTAHVTVEVGAINHPPVVASGQAIVTIEDTGRTFTVTATDPDGNPLTFTAAGAAHGTVNGGTNGVFTYVPAAGYLGTDAFTVTVNDGHGGVSTQAVSVNVVELPDAGDFRLVTSKGWTGAIGGSGEVKGSNDHERVAVLDEAGTIAFDGSFNRGNDAIVLHGSAAGWTVVKLSASIALFSDGDTFVEVPVGGTGTSIVFDDGARTLVFGSGGAMQIGGQAIGTTLTSITAGPSAAAVPGGDDASALGRLFLSSGGVDVSAGGHLLVVGSNDADTLHLVSGEIQLDGSFTRANDTVTLDFAAGTWQASRTGSVLHLTGHGLDLTAPVGTGLTLDFPDSDRLVTFTGGDMTIGSQVITSSAQFLVA